MASGYLKNWTDSPAIVYQHAPRMGKRGLRVFVERVHAALQKVAGVQVVIGRPFEELAAGDSDEEIMVRDHADIPRLANITDPGVLLLIATAYLGGAII